MGILLGEVTDVADHNEDGFKVVDRRPFTAEGELRKDVAEEQEREAKREELKHPVAEAPKQEAVAPQPPVNDDVTRAPLDDRQLIRLPK